MEHYFIDKAHSDSDYFEYSDSVLGHNMTFKSCDSVFSKDHIDDGTRALLNKVGEYYDTLDGDALDFGCGVGVIGITLKKHFPSAKVHMCDINATCVRLSKKNCVKNNVECEIVESDLYANVGQFDHIITNPPIKVGKKILFGVVSGAYDHLKDGGDIVLVIRKSHGEESMKKHMQAVFGNATILGRDKGFYILRSQKQQC